MEAFALKRIFMDIIIKKYDISYSKEARDIWNTVVEDGNAFPQDEPLNESNSDNFFNEQTYSGIAIDINTNDVVGLYILHPNNVGRCGHICNASYAVKKDIRGKHIGEQLVLNCIEAAKKFDFKILQFNAVVASNIHALHLYERLGFKKLGTIPGGFRMPDGSYADIIPHYYVL